jgi:hypothetical protein
MDFIYRYTTKTTLPCYYLNAAAGGGRVPFKEVFKRVNGRVKCYHFGRLANLKMAKVNFNMMSVVTYQGVLGSCVLVNEVWIEYVEFVTLDNLWGRVVHIVVGLIILVPFKTGVYPATET